MKSRVSNKGDIGDQSEERLLDSQDEGLVWVRYINKDYGFSFDRPKLLNENKLDDSGEYLLFVRFEENQNEHPSGIGLGVRKSTLVEEVDELKKKLDRDFEVKLVSEHKEEIDGFDAVVLQYEPKNKNILELRSFLIVNNGEHSISISTVPDQIDRIITSFKFL